MIKKYKLIYPPFIKHIYQTHIIKKSIYQTTEKEAKEYFKWFIKIIPERLEILKKALKDTGYNQKKLDFSEKSLNYFGEWFAKHISKRTLTKEEKEFEKTRLDTITIKKRGLKIPLKEIEKIPKYVLSYETESLCFDVGIYFAKILEKYIKGLKWDFVKKPKNDVFYHSPVLTGFKCGPLQPDHVMAVLALNIIEKKENSSILRETYEVWKSYSLSGKKTFWDELVEFERGYVKKQMKRGIKVP